jgi:hypothetical protein
MKTKDVGIRWTIGDVSDYGFEALRLSIWSAWNLFGPTASYAVCVNSLDMKEARARTQNIPDSILWFSCGSVPSFLKPYLDPGMAEGVAWKFSPLRLFKDRYELSLDNDCIFWEMPKAIQLWLDQENQETCVIAEDVRACFGQFRDFCADAPRNSGIRGLPPTFDFESSLRSVLEENPVVMRSELDEQGLQVAAITRRYDPLIVKTEEVSICSPFPPHSPSLGSCGAHFVGLNAKQMPWSLENRPAVEHIRDNWFKHRDLLYDLVGISPS